MCLSPHLFAGDQWRPDASLVKKLMDLPEKNIKKVFDELVADDEKIKYAVYVGKRLVFKVRDVSKAKIFLSIADNKLKNYEASNNELATLNMLHMSMAKRNSDYKAAIKYGVKTLQILREKDEQYLRRYSYVLNTVSDSYYALGNYKSALKYSLELVREANAVKNAGVTAGALFAVAEAHYKLSSLDEAEKAANDSYLLYSKLGNARGMGHAKKVLGSVYGAQGRLDKSRESFIVAIRYYEKIKYNHGIANCNFNLGLMNKRQKKLDVAIKYFEEASFYYMESGSASGAGMAKMELGNVSQTVDEGNKTFLLYGEARLLLAKSNKMARLAQLETYAGDFYIKKGQKEKARQAFSKALKIYKDADNKRYIKHIKKRLMKLKVVSIDD